MGGRRKLVHGTQMKREPSVRGRKRKLFFTTLTILPFLASQAPATLLSKKESTGLQPPAITKPKAPVHNCAEEVKGIIFEPNEVVREMVCGKNHTFVLTNISLIVVIPNDKEEAEKPAKKTRKPRPYEQTLQSKIKKPGPEVKAEARKRGATMAEFQNGRPPRPMYKKAVKV